MCLTDVNERTKESRRQKKATKRYLRMKQCRREGQQLQLCVGLTGVKRGEGERKHQ